MNRYRCAFCGWLLAGVPAGTKAQTLAGDGLNGAYYGGLNFERYALTRSDAAVDFNWHQSSPAVGVPAENFSVRWTGYLMPPATGRYVLCVVVDDGMRLWLNGRQLLNEWRGQSISTYRVAVHLQAGTPYALRIDYCQYGYDSRALLAWELPGKPAASSWRNLWGAATATASPEAIPTRYLFTYNPLLPPAKPALAAHVNPAPPPPPAAPRKPRRPQAAPVTKPLTRFATTLPAAAPRRQPVPDSARLNAVAARLAAGQEVTLRSLYFEQGKASLLPSVQASLDTLAAALRRHPGLRLEVQGHTDNQGDATLNRQLSQQRAEAVCQYLLAHGIATERLRPVGYGGTQPIADNLNPALRAQNRRVVFRSLP